MTLKEIDDAFTEWLIQERERIRHTYNKEVSPEIVLGASRFRDYLVKGLYR